MPFSVSILLADLHQNITLSVGAPLLLLFMLSRHRDSLNPRHTSALDDLMHSRDVVVDHREEKAVIESRKENAALAAEPITSFAMMYRPQASSVDILVLHQRVQPAFLANKEHLTWSVAASRNKPKL